MNQLELNDYISKSIKSMLKSAFKNSLQNPKEAAFLTKSGRIVQKSVRRRKEMERKGYHIPPFFIGTVTSRQSADASYAVKITILQRKCSQQRIGIESSMKLSRWASVRLFYPVRNHFYETMSWKKQPLTKISYSPSLSMVRIFRQKK